MTTNCLEVPAYDMKSVTRQSDRALQLRVEEVAFFLGSPSPSESRTGTMSDVTFRCY